MTIAVAGLGCLLLFAAILIGTRVFLDTTIETALRSEADRNAEILDRKIVESYSELRRLAVNGRASAAFREKLDRLLGQDDGLVQFKVFNRRGRLRYVLDEQRWFEQGGDIQSDAAALAAEQDRHVLKILRPDLTYFRDSYLTRVLHPIRTAEGDVVGTYEIIQDHSATASLFAQAFQRLTLALPLFAAFVFLLPAMAWLAVRCRGARNAVLVHDLARMDSLTGLMNRTTFTQEANRVFDKETGAFQTSGILIVDIDHFRLLNDAHGHKVADAFLKQVAGTIAGTVRREDLVARFGGDEFVALLPDVGALELQEIAHRIFRRLGRPFRTSGVTISSAASIGTYLTRPGDTLDCAMQSAELAQAHAKTAGRKQVVAYTESLDREKERRRAIEAVLRDAWLNGHAHLVYQPVIDAGSKEITGFEALMRLTSPSGEEISPEEFIPIAEDTGMIRDLGLAALRSAMETALAWPGHSFVAVNLSPAQFHPGDLVEQVGWLLEELRFPPERLELEITETLLLSEDASVKEQFNGLKALGVSLAMDDFGTGFSSLSYLLAHDFDKLKIDRMFLIDLDGNSDRQRNVLRSIIALGHDIGMKVTAEGVEGAAQEELLTAMGCDLLQGFYYNRPMPASEIDALFGARKLGGVA